MVRFEITESEVIRLTGYCRQHLRQLRQGRTQVQNGKEYVTEATIENGVDYEIRYACKKDFESNKNGRVFYSKDCIKKLKKRKGSVRELINL
jgi:type III secretory pathway component EscV